MPMSPSSSSSSVPPVLVAHTLLGKLVLAARRAGDTGREFVYSGVYRLTGREIEARQQHAAAAVEVARDAGSVDTLISEALTDPVSPGVITPTEATVIRACCRKTERAAGQLAQRLAVPEVAP